MISVCFQKYCQYLITVAYIRHHCLNLQSQNNSRRGKQNTSDDEANVIAGKFIAHLRDFFIFYYFL